MAFEAGKDGIAPLFIAGRGDEAARFVEHEIDMRGEADGFAFHGDLIPVDLHRLFGIAAKLAVEGDFARFDQQTGLTARAVAEL